MSMNCTTPSPNNSTTLTRKIQLQGPLNALQWLHVVIGCIGIVEGFIILVLKKGTLTHKALGRVWMYAMIAMSITAYFIYVDGLPALVVFFILSLFITMTIGHFTIRLRDELRYHEDTKKRPSVKTIKYMKWVHGTCMFYAWVMLFGAGIAGLVRIPKFQNSEVPYRNPRYTMS